MVGGLFKEPKTLSDLEEEDEKLESEYSIAQKKVAIAELKKRGLKPSHFSFNWSAIVNWLKTH